MTRNEPIPEIRQCGFAGCFAGKPYVCRYGPHPNCLGRLPEPEQIAICKTWITKWVDRRKTINRNWHSYHLKHLVEESWIDDPYVSNGAFIRAAVELGYDYEPCDWCNPNAYFNMSFERLKDYIVSRIGVRRVQAMSLYGGLKKIKEQDRKVFCDQYGESALFGLSPATVTPTEEKTTDEPSSD